MSKILILLFLISYIVSLSLSTLIPQYRKVKELQKELANKELILKTREQYIKELEQSSRRIDEHEKELAKMGYAMPSRADTSYLLEFLDETVFKAGIILRNIDKVSKSTEKKKAGEANWAEVSFRLTGTYDSFLDFLERVEKTARLVEVDFISFAAESLEEEQEIEMINEAGEEFKTPSFFSFEVKLSAPYFAPEDKQK